MVIWPVTPEAEAPSLPSPQPLPMTGWLSSRGWMTCGKLEYVRVPGPEATINRSRMQVMISSLMTASLLAAYFQATLRTYTFTFPFEILTFVLFAALLLTLQERGRQD